MIRQISGYRVFKQWKQTYKGKYRNWSKLSKESKLIFDSTAFHINRICNAFQFKLKLIADPIIDVTIINDSSQTFLLTVVYFTTNKTNFVLVKARLETDSLVYRTPRLK